LGKTFSARIHFPDSVQIPFAIPIPSGSLLKSEGTSEQSLKVLLCKKRPSEYTYRTLYVYRDPEEQGVWGEARGHTPSGVA
jgi:hypothetical protein